MTDKRFNALSKDIGALFPQSMVATFPMGFVVQPVESVTTLTLGGATHYNWYEGFVSLWPYDDGKTLGPFRNGATFGATTTTAWADASGNGVQAGTSGIAALGIGRFFGSSGASSVYSKMAVLKVTVDLTLQFNIANYEQGFLGADGPWGWYQGFHFLEAIDKAQDLQSVTSSAARVAGALSQPNVKFQASGRPEGVDLRSSAPATTAYYQRISGHKVRWRTAYYPHELLKQPFRDYVADSNSYGTTAAYPASLCGLHWFGSFPLANGAGAGLAPNGGFVFGRIDFTVLLKDIVGTLS